MTSEKALEWYKLTQFKFLPVMTDVYYLSEVMLFFAVQQSHVKHASKREDVTEQQFCLFKVYVMSTKGENGQIIHSFVADYAWVMLNMIEIKEPSIMAINYEIKVLQQQNMDDRRHVKNLISRQEKRSHFAVMHWSEKVAAAKTAYKLENKLLTDGSWRLSNFQTNYKLLEKKLLALKDLEAERKRKKKSKKRSRQAVKREHAETKKSMEEQFQQAVKLVEMQRKALQDATDMLQALQKEMVSKKDPVKSSPKKAKRTLFKTASDL